MSEQIQNESETQREPDAIEGTIIPAGPQNTRLGVFKQVALKTPSNDLGLPDVIYRSDVITEDFPNLDLVKQGEMLEAASIVISYREGFPTLPDGTSLWSQLPFESDDHYVAFKKYLEQVDTLGIRRLEVIAQDGTVTQETLTCLFDYYYWSPRCKAYDLFRIAASEKMREQRIMKITDVHFLESEKMLTPLLHYFNELDEDGKVKWLQDIEPKDALAALDKLMKIQRVSAGMSAHGGQNGEVAPVQGQSLEVRLRQIVKSAEDPLANNNQSGTTDWDILLNNPEAAMQIQDLAIKVHRQ